MSKIDVALEYCYGIRKLDHVFDFSKTSVVAIYAANGSMKSSLAQVFDDISKSELPRDRHFPERKTVCNVRDENGVPIEATEIFSVKPYDDAARSSEKISTLLVDSKLRAEYERIYADVDAAKQKFLGAMKKQSNTRRDIEREISVSFGRTDDDFFRGLRRAGADMEDQKGAPFKDVPYDTVFDEKVVAFLDTADFRTAIQEYVHRYNELLDMSPFFRKGVFDYYNAETIAKTLAGNGFFDAAHTIRLNSAESKEVNTHEELVAVINAEKEAMADDQELKQKFANIDKAINKNVGLRDFRAFVQANQELTGNLANIELFREEVWKSYFFAHKDLFDELLQEHQASRARLAEIEEEAKTQKTQWEEVIEIFNSRFFVPFRLVARNRLAMMCGYESILEVGFIVEDGGDRAEVERSALIESLSMGEKKALYILDIIFEIEVRKRAEQPTLFVVDDIADSFDYKNKYAIIEYLRDIAAEKGFRQILLTHNFDFFRTVCGRYVRDQNCFMASKADDGIVLAPAIGVRNVFTKDWKSSYCTDIKKQVACIPFLRNIVEYTKGGQDDAYKCLTSLLHWKPGTATITVTQLNALFKDTFGIDAGASDTPVVELIQEAAERCLVEPEGAALENKVVLAISIRLNAEKYMIAKIADDEFVSDIKSNQTFRLFERFRKDFAEDVSAISTMQRVMLMTPESIHLNSFMYEPILDMSDNHLRKLHADVCALA